MGQHTRDDTEREKKFEQRIIRVLEYYDIEHETEKTVPSPDTPGRGRRMDLYIPKTDTAIELKMATGSLEKGVGQALNYTRSCKEAILILDGEATDAYRPDIHKTCQIAPAVHFAMLMPNPNPSAGGKAGFDIRTDSRPHLFFEMKHGADWSEDDNMIAIDNLTPGYDDPINRGPQRTSVENSLRDYN